MAVIPSLLLLLVISCLVALFIVLVSKKDISGVKIMLLGINITLFGGVFALKSNFKMEVIEYSIALLGLIISISGLIKKD